MQVRITVCDGPTRPAPQQPGNPLIELAVALDPDGVTPALGLQEIEQRRDGKGGVTSEIAPGDRGSRVARISCRHRAQHILPAIGAVDIAGTQRTSLQIAELVEHEQWVQALGLEMPVPHCTFLIAMHRALGAVHIQRDALRRPPVMHRVDPAAGQISEGGEVLRSGQHLRLEPTHGAGRRRTPLHRTSTDELAHHRITAQSVGVVDVLIAGKAWENRLAQKAGEIVAAIPASARIGDQPRRHVRQPEGVVQLAVEQ